METSKVLNKILNPPDGGFVFTVTCPPEVAQKHAPFYSYRVEHVPATARWPENYFVHVTRSPTDQRFVYLGKLNTHTGQVELTQASAFPAHSFRLRLVNRVLARLWSDDLESVTQHGYKVYKGKYRSVKRRRRGGRRRWIQPPVMDSADELNEYEQRCLYL